MKILLGTICVCLLVILCVLLWKYISLKRNIRHFSQELDKLKSTDYRQPMKVTDFDKDLVELAVKVNEHTDIQRQLGVEYEQRKQQLGTVISGISHDFRTPLTASLGYLQMIEKSGELSEKNAEYLTVAMQKNKYLKELSDEFFEVTKTENSNENLSLEDINLSNVLTEALLEQHGWISERNITANFDVPDGIIVLADMHCLSRILSNLMSNAQKYTADSYSSNVDISRVFEPFYRMDSRTAGGSGLGLYVVKLLCSRMNWDVIAKLDSGIFTVEICF